jgi:DNA polymerase
MSNFDEATRIVHEALLQFEESGGRELRASRESLTRLTRTRSAPLQTAHPIGTPAKHVAPVMAFATPGECGKKADLMAALQARALVCEKCEHLVRSRTQVVFGVGNIDAELMFVGEAPGADEDAQGEPFVGKAGQLLTKIIEAMGFSRNDVYIGNVLKCRPDMPAGEPGNRKPRPDEMATCLPYLIEQIEIIRPRVMVALGATAMEGLLQAKEPMNRLRGHWHEFHGIPLMATYHPAYLLRNQSNTEKRKVWEDMLLVLEKLGKPVSEKQRNYFLPKSGA